MCDPNEHKFRTNLDGITVAGGASAGIHSKAPLTPYVTVVFCEKCGFVAHNGNYANKSDEAQKFITTPTVKELINPGEEKE